MAARAGAFISDHDFPIVLQANDLHSARIQLHIRADLLVDHFFDNSNFLLTGELFPARDAPRDLADTSHDSVVPLSAPPDTVRYDATTHGPKPVDEFDRPVWGKFDIFVRLSPAVSDAQWQRITSVEGWEAHWDF